jgi:phosphatidylglycerol:prolipoprotein diacylglycerol transferase
MVPVLFSVGPITVYTFGAMMALAFLVAGYAVSVELERKELDPELAWSIVLWAAVGGIAGSRLFVIFSDWQGFLERPISFLVTGSGFIWYGGLVGGFLSVSILIARESVPWLRVVDAIAPALAIGQAIGRIGCQVSGDGDWGKPTTLPWGMSYPQSIIGWEAWTRGAGLSPDVRVHPAPVYETLAYSAIFAALWATRDRDWPDGSRLWLYLVGSSIARFAIESVRVEPVIGAGLTQAQWIAIVLFVLGSVLLVVRRRARAAS